MRRAVRKEEEEMEDIQDLDAFTEAEGRQLLAAAFETVPADPVLAGHGLGGNGLAGAQLLRRVRRRTSRRRRVRMLVPAGAVAALGGAVALAVTLTATVADAPSALAAVTAAAAKTSADSFSFTVTQTAPAICGSGFSCPGHAQITGVFDPRHGLGEEEIVAGQNVRTQVLFIGGHTYAKFSGNPGFLGHGKTWLEGLMPPPLPSGTAGVPIFGFPWITEGFNGNVPIDPGALLGLLKSVDSIQAEGPANGPGWTGTKYAFTVSPPKQEGDIATTSGTVYVDNQGRVRRLMTTARWQVHSSSTNATQDFAAMYNLSFGGFGVRVSVTAPPASQVNNQGGVLTIAPGWIYRLTR